MLAIGWGMISCMIQMMFKQTLEFDGLSSWYMAVFSSFILISLVAKEMYFYYQIQDQEDEDVENFLKD